MNKLGAAIEKYDEQLFLQRLSQHADTFLEFKCLQLNVAESDTVIVVFAPWMYNSNFFLLRSVVAGLHKFIEAGVGLIFYTDAADKFYVRDRFFPEELLQHIELACNEKRVFFWGTSIGGSAAIFAGQRFGRPSFTVNPLITVKNSRGLISSDVARHIKNNFFCIEPELSLLGMSTFSRHPLDSANFALVKPLAHDNYFAKQVRCCNMHKYFWPATPEFMIARLNKWCGMAGDASLTQ